MSKKSKPSMRKERFRRSLVTRRRKVSVVQYHGYHAVYPGQSMLEKRNADKSKNTVTWADIIPDQTYKTGNWKITVEYEAV